jgi:hypothetical protein
MTSTRAFVQTRGAARAGDYAFLGHAPEEPWWRAYRDATAFDHPTVLVTADGERWAAYLSGIPSGRVDAVGRVVRYTLVLDGPCGAAETGCVVAGVAAWLNDVAAGPDRGGGELAAALDAGFPGDLVERMLARPSRGRLDPASADGGERGDTHRASRRDTDATAVESRVLDALATLPVPSPGATVAGSWFGGVGSPRAREAFVARVGAVLGGTPGRALLLNLVGGPDDAAAVLEPGLPVAVLVDGAAPDRVIPLRSEVDAKKAPAPPVGTAAAPRTRSAGAAAVARVGVLAVLAVALTVLAAVILLL